jgi:predicted short-subunit dehydrogenase-like oxidoreductase (DUF2520 family)
VSAAGGEEPRPTLAVVGAGRAGSALAVAAHDAGYRVVAVHSRTRAAARALAGLVGAEPVATALAAVMAADLTLLTVPDGAITSVAATLAATGAALRGRGVVHCSAVRGREALAPLRATAAAVGAVHPLQALSVAESAALLRGSGFAVDADAGLRSRLERLVADLGGTVLPLAGIDRRLYHAAAVLAGNAPLTLLAAAADLLAEAGMDRRTAETALAALLAGAAANAGRAGARAALTGPLVRGDTETVASHLDALRGHPHAEALYRDLLEETARLAGRPSPRRAGAARRRAAA